VLVAGAQHEVQVQNERARRLARANRDLGAPAGNVAIKAPIPGLVVKVPVAVGQQVAHGETLIILEAMKMENELRAPRAGTIREIRVTTGEQVNLGQVLLHMD
jgi:biotin carboxyl carrier protein